MGHEGDGTVKMGMGQGCGEPLGHVSGSHVEKARQDMAGNWSLHVGSSWWPRVPDFCEALDAQHQKGGNPPYPTQPGCLFQVVKGPTKRKRPNFAQVLS